MKILGYSISNFVGKNDKEDHECLSVNFGDCRDDETHIGFSYITTQRFVDRNNEFYDMISKYYKEKTDLVLLYNQYGKVQEIQKKN